MIKILCLSILLFSYIKAGDCKDTLFTFDIPKQSSNVKVIDIVENMASKCKFSVKIKDDEAVAILNENLFLVYVEDYTLEDMFDFLFTQNNLFYTFNDEKKILNVSYFKTQSFVIDYVNLSEHSTESTKNVSIGASAYTDTSSTNNQNGGNNGSYGYGSNSDSTTVVSKSEFKFWDNISSDIDSILSRDGDVSIIKSKSIINSDTGVITITGTKSQINRIDEYLQKLKNRMHKQVVLEAKVIEVIYSDSTNTGIDWSNFQASLSGSLTDNTWTDISAIGASNSGHFSYDFSINALLSFLDTYGDINIVSTPKIMTLNNQPAVINAGDQINYRYLVSSVTTYNDNNQPLVSNEYASGSTFIGVTLGIVPEITDYGYIVLRINPVISELNENSNSFDANGMRVIPPDTRVKQLSSIVKAKSGAKVVIGGLVSYSSENEVNKVKGLGDIPLVGYAFKNETKGIIKKELIIVVTPTIVNYDNFPSIENVEDILRLEGN